MSTKYMMYQMTVKYMYQMAIKYASIFHCNTLLKLPKLGLFGLKICRPATLCCSILAEVSRQKVLSNLPNVIAFTQHTYLVNL
jgi:hypothetical protein